MFETEINLFATQQNHSYANRPAQLNRGLSQMEGGEQEVSAKVPYPSRDPFDTILERWDSERLHPASCNLRSAVLMRNGVATGEKGLAQLGVKRPC